MKHRIIALLLAFVLLCAGCAPQKPADTASQQTSSVPTTEPEETTVPETTAPEVPVERQLVVYFANWYLDTKTAQEGAEVCSIPWDKVTYVNHAFWGIEPDDGTTETSFERRDAGQEPRTKFKIVSTLEKADFEDQTPSTMAEGLPRNHFAQYAAYSEKYPDVNIMISVGGWTRCGYFSEMAYTSEGRASFVNSCVELMKQYPWIDGIDIDWEYFGGSKDGERKPEDDNDQGCPIWGIWDEDSYNFAKLAKEMRETFDAEFGPGVKKLTACASGSTGWTLPMQKWEEVGPYMDLINIMTYDMAGTWDHRTGHASNANHCKDAITIMNYAKKCPKDKLCIGSPMYGTDLKMREVPEEGKAVGAPIEPTAPSKEELTQEMLRSWEKEAVSGYAIDWVDGKPEMGKPFDNGGTGWHCAYDNAQRSAYMYNDDPDSEYYLWYISYENPLTLQAKLDLVEAMNVAGMLVWECSQDTYDHQLINQMSDNLFK